MAAAPDTALAVQHMRGLSVVADAHCDPSSEKEALARDSDAVVSERVTLQSGKKVTLPLLCLYCSGAKY
jgi:hypothetical protein